MTDAEMTRMAGRTLEAATTMLASLPGENRQALARLKGKAIEIILGGASGFSDPFTAVTQHAQGAKPFLDRITTGAMTVETAFPTIVEVRRTAVTEAVEGRWAGFWGLDAVSQTFTIAGAMGGSAAAAILSATESLARAQDLLAARGKG